MKSCYYLGNGEFEVREEEIPEIGPEDVLVKVAALINSGRINLAPILTHRYPLERLKEAVLMQQSDESLKVLITPNV